MAAGGTTEKIIILGSGPAGLTAAIYAARANLEPLMVEGLQPGGQLTITTDVENYPGYPEGVEGPKMMEDLRKQAARFGTRFLTGDCTSVDFSGRPLRLWLGEEVLSCHALVISTGASAKLLGIPSEKKLMGFGVSACATCDGFFFRNQEVIVVGGGDTALEEALYLTKMCSKVYLVHRRDKLRASKIMQERARKNPKIAFIWESAVDEILGEPGQGGGVRSARLKNLKTGQTKEMPISGVFVAIGHQPNTALFQGKLAMNPAGYLTVRPGTTYTDVEGVFAAGDVADPHYRQAVTAAGTGCMAAIDAERWLASQGVE